MANPTSFANMEDILNQSRAIVGDSYNSGAGEILTDTAPFTNSYINSSLQELQDRLRNNAVVTLTVDNYIISGLEAVGLDPSLQTYIDVNGYNSVSASGTAVIDAALTLPVDMMVPQVVSECETGSGLPFTKMTQPMEGLASRNQQPALGQWEWRGNALWFNGATTIRDIKLRYQKQEANIIPGTDYTTVYVDLPGAGNALSYLIGLRYVMSRNPETAPILRAEADKYIREIIKTSVRQKQGISYQRRPFGDTANDLSYGSGQSHPW